MDASHDLASLGPDGRLSDLKHIHLEPIGGVAGDMFVASLLDAWPDLADATFAAVRAAGLGDDIGLDHLAFQDDVLSGSRFAVAQKQQRAAPLHHGPGSAGPRAHEHVHWRSLRQQLCKAPLPAGVGDRAIAIFSLLAEAEAGVHGVPVDEATFHEVGAWDSIADIVAAAFLIETIGETRWSVGPLPLGSGRVRCAHGELPVPAPATMRLLEGFVFHDDGRPGERVTPTGAAILKHLQPSSKTASGRQRLLRTGYGFGARRLEGMSNVLRASVFEPVATKAPAHDEVGVISFEIDDQTAEDLAIGLDHLRRRDDVLDIVQMPAFGKKGRMATSLRLLVRPAEAVGSVIEACFRETTTLGVRWAIEKRATLERHVHRTEIGADVKFALRPDGNLTAKAESDDLASLSGHQTRQGEAARGGVRSRGSARIGALTVIDLGEQLNALHRSLEDCGPAAIALSGGVDSMTLAYIAHRRPAADVAMFHAVSPAVPVSATDRVKAYAAREGWLLTVLDAGEFADERYMANPANRCFFCKSNLYGTLASVTERQLLSGTNLDTISVIGARA